MGMFDKRIIAWKQNIGEDGRDRGEIQLGIELRKDALAVLEIKTLHTKESEVFDKSDLTIDIFRASQVAEKSVLGRAIVGGVLLGGVGAIVGGLSGSGKADAWIMEINGSELFRLKNDADKKTVEKWYNK